MENIYMNSEELAVYNRDINSKLTHYVGLNSEFKKWFKSLPENAKNDFLHNFFATKSIKECVDIAKYCFHSFKMASENMDIIIRKVIYNENLDIMFDFVYNYRGSYGLKSRHVSSLADAICETTSMRHVFPIFELLSKNTIYEPGFSAILKSKDMQYINKLIDKLIEKPTIVNQDQLEKLVDTLLRIDDPNTIHSFYRVVDKVLGNDIEKCIKQENIKYILEKSNRFFELGKKEDLEKIVLKSKNVHEIINLVHRENMNNERIDYDKVINSIIDNGFFDCEDNPNLLGHVVGMMRNYKFPLTSYRELEKYLLAIHMELIPEYVNLNHKTNYKYILEEMNNKHASEVQIEEFKTIIKESNNMFKKLIDSINYNKYKSK